MLSYMLNNARKCCIVSIKENIEELRELCRTLDLIAVAEIIQKRNRPDPNTFLGKGKLDELKKLANEVDLFVFDGQLKPSQHFRLETFLKKLCIDRIGLVLEIFERHAGSSEAKAQVTLARTRYELPFLREWINKSISDDRPGFLAGGEYAIDTYYENARKQMKRIEKTLTQIATERKLRRKRRRERGFYLVSICGYTNVGKSSLLNALSDAQVQVDNRMFSTLSTTTRRLSKEDRKILLTDTVGFITDLPPDLIDAFDATMEEIYGSDCIILTLDLLDDFETIIKKFSTSLKILVPKIDRSKIIIALNKIDKMTNEELIRKINLIEEKLDEIKFYLISAKNGDGIDDLIGEILKRIGITRQIHLSLSHDENGRKIYHWLSERFIVSDVEWAERITIELELTEDELEVIKKRFADPENIELIISPSYSNGN